VTILTLAKPVDPILNIVGLMIKGWEPSRRRLSSALRRPYPIRRRDAAARSAYSFVLIGITSSFRGI